MEAIRRIGGALDRLLFPRRAACLGCGSKIGCDRDWLCGDCERQLNALRHGEARTCAPPIVRRAHAVFYRAPVPGLIGALKYGSVALLADVLAREMAAACAVLKLDDAPLVVPAPMHPRRRRKRGYNHAELISRALARELGFPHADALIKLRNTRQQARLTSEKRERNLDGSVGVRGDVRGRAILLIDDVYTTGATMRACAQALAAAGAKHVYVLTYAVAGEPARRQAQASGRPEDC